MDIPFHWRTNAIQPPFLPRDKSYTGMDGMIILPYANDAYLTIIEDEHLD